MTLTTGFFVNSDGDYFAIINGSSYQIDPPPGFPKLSPGSYDDNLNPVDENGNKISVEALNQKLKMWPS